MEGVPAPLKRAALWRAGRYGEALETIASASEAVMTTLFRITVFLLLVGMLLGDILLASVGLVGVCSLAVYTSIQQDKQAACPAESEFLA